MMIMIENILIFLWGLFLILILSVPFRKMFGHSYIYYFQDFDKTDIPYITMDVQGMLLNFLVDTGCGVSIITKSVLDNISYEDSVRQVQLEALTSDSLHSGMVTIPITVNGKQLEEDFVLYDKDDIANFQAHYGITIHGILGNEFLNKTGCHIDYKKHTVTIS